ncbi:uncharacterized protein MELLADRAFT_112712 [Melampsora larici-populina 98AG31]|uniref:Secreted protein n=1 Tax=Melampsora larici-populina (strain 98AG31 / pathotype 3-4-7) TaxID=747676 RepID=F4S7C5_MELLP|nr:uncharacterized protein MELLADRAFT_112712 [Melampsora larici-populina 98AG31]EGF99498.1 secreted protein [Melampsora larici-populina 98AG31]
MKLLSPPTLVTMSVLIIGVAQVGLCRLDCPFNQDESSTARVQILLKDCPLGNNCQGLVSHIGKRCPNSINGCRGKIEYIVEKEACNADILCRKHTKRTKKCDREVNFGIVKCNQSGCNIQAAQGERSDECTRHEKIACHHRYSE